jgi:hypothetical protein
MTMSQTVIGIFEQAMQAEDAKAYLIANGFNSEHIEVHSIAGSNFGNLPVAEDENIGDRISRFFRNLFDNEEDARIHAEAASRATTLTVYTTDEDQTKQAVQVLDNFGAVDVDNFVQSGGSGTVGSTSAEADIESLEEANEPLNTDLINTDMLNTDMSGVPGRAGSGTSPFDYEPDDKLQSGAIRQRSRIVDPPRLDSDGINTSQL